MCTYMASLGRLLGAPLPNLTSNRPGGAPVPPRKAPSAIRLRPGSKRILASKGHTDLKSCVPGAKFIKESDFDVKSRLAPPKSTENDEKRLSDTEKCRREFFGDFEKKNFGVEKSKVANRLKRVFPKFEADRSHVRRVNASSKYIPRKCPKYFNQQIYLIR